MTAFVCLFLCFYVMIALLLNFPGAVVRSHKLYCLLLGMRGGKGEVGL